ncbi:carboxypeptidase regulatory-like domain-containing protein [Geomonas terrae]|uniref:Carboxypeptidase regulatory-like domain-containing protein n=1 Tax=Geomonas terrae TaxID=2562681 RepID=A0A4V6R3K4_9BACT|nr:carboxypeptidase-like regulatory domain-containing protein [Geomonas terrae]TGU70282.1 carboxypeptidase regulatory-like domain-containing protein [Geomonas terrae]
MKLADLYKRGLIVALACAALLISNLSAFATALPGDCDGNGSVTMIEVQGAINMFLGNKTAASCVDTDQSGAVTITELRNVVNAYLGLPVMIPALAVTGTVKDPVSGLAVTGATVTAYADGASTPAATATVQSTGSFSLSGLSAASTYQLVFSKTGYGDVNYYGVKPSQSAATALETVLMLTTDKASLTTSINGYVLNASNNTGAALTLRFRPGLGATTGNYQAKTADGYGYYYKDYFPAGCYTAEVLKLVDGVETSYGYFTVYAVPGVSTYNNSQNFTADTGTTPSTTYRAVLSWGSAERDLDLHVTGPLNPDDTFTTIGSSNTPRFHVGTSTSDPQTSYPYGSAITGTTLRNLPTATTEAYLDQDQANHGVDNGSETFTILTQQAGVYRFYVYNNSATGYLAESGAQLKLYRGTTLVKSYTVPNKAGNTWTVFELDGDTVTDKNIMSTVDPTQTYNLAKPVAGYPVDELSTFKQVQKALPTR